MIIFKQDWNELNAFVQSLSARISLLEEQADEGEGGFTDAIAGIMGYDYMKKRGVASDEH